MKPYYRPPPHMFWLHRKPYFMFIIREMTSLFIAGFCLFLLVFIYSLGQGRETFDNMVAFLDSTFMISVHWIVLVFALYHTFTWFNLTPKVMVVWIGEKKVPEFMVLGAVYGGWIGVSIVIAWLILY